MKLKRKAYKVKPYCKRGHDASVHAYFDKNHKKICRECCRLRKQKSRSYEEFVGSIFDDAIKKNEEVINKSFKEFLMTGRAPRISMFWDMVDNNIVLQLKE